ncbi:MAG: porin OmpL1 [Leptospirales bacterium]|nr:porin OmpL1 [Leptospirales bacterium]
MKKLKLVALGVALAISTSSVYAEGSYLGFAAGLQFDLGSLAGTITKDGLDSSKFYAENGLSCGANTSCNNSPAQQKAIIPENTLIGLERATAGAIRANTSGPMHGLDLGLFYEQEGDGMFFRIGLSHVTKILGGETESTLLQGSPIAYTWYKIHWNYYAWHIPAYFGLKAGVGESGAVYAGVGINYSWGGWEVGGFNNGDAVALLTSQGATTTVSPSPSPARGSQPIFAESVKFRVRSISPNFVIGVEHKLASGDKLFIEFETIVGGGYGTVGAKSTGGALALAPFPVYPISLSGTHYKFGYKLAL